MALLRTALGCGLCEAQVMAREQRWPEGTSAYHTCLGGVHIGKYQPVLRKRPHGCPCSAGRHAQANMDLHATCHALRQNTALGAAHTLLPQPGGRPHVLFSLGIV